MSRSDKTTRCKASCRPRSRDERQRAWAPSPPASPPLCPRVKWTETQPKLERKTPWTVTPPESTGGGSELGLRQPSEQLILASDFASPLLLAPGVSDQRPVGQCAVAGVLGSKTGRITSIRCFRKVGLRMKHWAPSRLRDGHVLLPSLLLGPLLLAEFNVCHARVDTTELDMLSRY